MSGSTVDSSSVVESSPGSLAETAAETASSWYDPAASLQLVGRWTGWAHSNTTGHVYETSIDFVAAEGSVAQVTMTNTEATGQPTGQWLSEVTAVDDGWVVVPTEWVYKPNETWSMDGFRLANTGGRLVGSFFDPATNRVTGPLTLSRE